MYQRGNHNAHIAYPIEEDVPGLVDFPPDSADWTLCGGFPACVLLDARIVAMGVPAPVSAVLDSVADLGDCRRFSVSVSSPGGSAGILIFDLPFNSAPPCKIVCRTVHAYGYLVFGPCALRPSWPDAAAYPLAFSPAVCSSLFRHRLDSMRGTVKGLEETDAGHAAESEAEWVGRHKIFGRCALEEGANVRVRVDMSTNTMFIDAGVGIGPKGLNCVPEDRDCAANIYTVNGLPLGWDGDLRIEAGPGVAIGASPGEVRVGLARPMDSLACADAVDPTSSMVRVPGGAT
jgi:hypothetical protein